MPSRHPLGVKGPNDPRDSNMPRLNGINGQVEPSPETKSKMASPELVWSKATYNMTSLMARYSNKFPIIVMVNRGYYGNFHIDTLASSQVARLHTWGMQERVMARDIRGRYISIPLDYEIDFEVLNKKGSKKKKFKPKKLKAIIKDSALPVDVQFPKKEKWHFRVGSQRYYTKDFGKIEIMKVYQQRFLKGNTIHNGIIDTKVMLVPMYVNVTFKVALGAKGQTQEEWAALTSMYDHAVSHINFDAIRGTKDMTEYPANLEPIENEGLTDDELDNDDGTDANANLTTMADMERNKPHMNGGLKLIGDQRNDIISIPVRQNLVMQVAKHDLERASMHSRSEAEQRSMIRSDMSDYSSVSGGDRAFHKQNVVHVSIGDDAQVITQEMYDHDFRQNGPIHRHTQPLSIHGSTIINVTSDDAEIFSTNSQYHSMSRSESNLRQTFSDMDFQDNSVFLSNSGQYIEVPNYASRRRYKQSYPSFSSSDVSRTPRVIQKRYGQVLVGGAPVAEERRYHSMKDLSRIDGHDSGVSRVASFRSTTMTTSPDSQKSNGNLYMWLTDEQPHDRFIKRIEIHEEPNKHPIGYTRRAGVERANKVASTSRTRHGHSGVYFTDGQQNFPLQNKQHRPGPEASSYDTTDYVEVIEEDFTHSAPNLYTQAPPTQSPVLSTSSNEDSKHYFVMYDNGSTKVPVVNEAHENGEDYIYQGSMMLRKGRDFEQLSMGEESMIDIPIEDVRSRGRYAYSSSSNHDEANIPVHDLRTNQIVNRSYAAHKVESRPLHHGSRLEATRSEVTRRIYDEVDGEEDYIEGHVDMTKGAAEHYSRVMDLSPTPSNRHKVPIEYEGKKSAARGINESMFEGGHHSHSFTHDRGVCQRLEARRRERSNSHRELSLNRARRQRQMAAGGHGHSSRSERLINSRSSGISISGPGIQSGYSAGARTSRSSSANAGYKSESTGGYEFRTNRNEVWSDDAQGFGIMPLTTTEHEVSELLRKAEGQRSPSPLGRSPSPQNRSPSPRHRSTSPHGRSLSPIGATQSVGLDVHTSLLQESTGFKAVSKGSTSTYSDSSMSSNSGDIGEHGEGAVSRSYDLTALDDIPVSYDASEDTAGPAATAAAAAMAEGNMEIHGDERISRKKARELTRTGSVRSLREVYARSRSPSTSQRDKPRMAVAPATEVFADILNDKPTNEVNGEHSSTTTTTTKTTKTTQESNVLLRNKTGRGGASHGTTGTHNAGDQKPGAVQGDQDMAWQETQSYHLESIRDSIRDLDEYLKKQGAESDSQSLNSPASSKHLEHFSYALTDPTTY